MSPEIPRQFNMFTNEWDDNRTSRQKKLDRERGQLKQQEMFSQHEVAQFGVNPHPLLPLSEHTKLGLIFEDPRTEEEIERDRQQAAEKRTYQMFVEPVLDDQTITPDKNTLAMVVYEAPCLALIVIEVVNRAVIPLTEASKHDPQIRCQMARMVRKLIYERK
jgi:hypothetical protein